MYISIHIQYFMIETILEIDFISENDPSFNGLIKIKKIS